MPTLVLVTGSPKILGLFLQWKRSSGAQLKAVTGRLCGRLISNTTLKLTGEPIIEELVPEQTNSRKAGTPVILAKTVCLSQV